MDKIKSTVVLYFWEILIYQQLSEIVVRDNYKTNKR